MSGSLSYSVEIDDDIYDLHIDYYIDGYSDPETGEYFGDTSWNLTYTRISPGGSGRDLSGFSSSEGDSITAGLLLDYTPGLFHYHLEFKAWNTFSGDLHPLLASW